MKFGFVRRGRALRDKVKFCFEWWGRVARSREMCSNVKSCTAAQSEVK